MEKFPYEKLLDWPFLAFVFMGVTIFYFRVQVSERISKIQSLDFGKYGKIVLGHQSADPKDIGDSLIKSLQEFEERLEKLEADTVKRDTSAAEEQSLTSEKLPAEFAAKLWASVLPMLRSTRWFARYVDTLARNTSVSTETMIKLLSERPEVTLFQDGEKLAASLKTKAD